ncbi:MAG: transcriptional repressor [Candidatus Zixiibacteriota bacterium]
MNFNIGSGGVVPTAEREIFNKFIRSEGLRETSQRTEILNTFLNTEDHVSVDDLYSALKRRKRRIGYATVHRTMKLIAECGLARVVIFDDGVARFENRYNREHHHHLVCTHCKKIIEFSSRRMEEGESSVLKRHNFTMESHRYEIFGICGDCRKQSDNKQHQRGVPR